MNLHLEQFLPVTLRVNKSLSILAAILSAILDSESCPMMTDVHQSISYTTRSQQLISAKTFSMHSGARFGQFYEQTLPDY